MTSPDLPSELKAALAQKLQGLSRNDAAQRSAAISQTYRDGGGSGAISTETDAVAYAASRMPATYAAVIAVLNALTEVRPDFAPTSLLDVGAGPGTRAGRQPQRCPSLASFALLDSNPALRALALELAHDSGRLHALRYDRWRRRHQARRDAVSRPRHRQLCHQRTQRHRARATDRPDVDEDGGHAAHRRTRHAGGLSARARRAPVVDRARRPCHRTLPACRCMSACRPRLVPFHPAVAALKGA